jgi:hypothetical protein
MTIRKLEGKTFLLREIGGFPEESNEEFQNAHTIYVKE